MTDYILWVFLLALWNSILFYGRDYGVNVILFMVPLVCYIYHLLKKNNKIKNKKGLLYIIPVILLSITYLLFDNLLFRVLDFFAIPILLTFVVIYTSGETYKVMKLIKKVFNILIVPYKYIARLFRVTKTRISEKLKVSDRGTKVVKMLLVVIPVTILIVALLCSADMIFGNIFGEFLDKILEVLRIEFIDRLLGRITMLIIMFFVIGCFTMYIIYEEVKEKKETKEEKKYSLFTTKCLVTILNIVYVLFDFIQIKSLVLQKVASNINYAEYARRGFFELLVVSLINLSIILITRHFETKENENEYKYVKIMNVIMVFLTVIIIASSFLRMHMYESAYGYTVLRLLVFAALITEAILMIPTVMYIFNKDFNIVKSYMIITLVAFLILNFMNMDYIIAKRNINRYYYTKDIDLDYLENYRFDNIPELVKLYNNVTDEKIKDELNNYLSRIKYDLNAYDDKKLEFTVSHYRAKKYLNNTEFTEYIDYELEDY